MKRSLDDWKALFAEQAASGKSIAAYCRELGLNEKRFYYQRKRLRSSDRVYSTLGPVEPARVTIELDGNLKLHVAVDQLRAVLDVLCD